LALSKDQYMSQAKNSLNSTMFAPHNFVVSTTQASAD